MRQRPAHHTPWLRILAAELGPRPERLRKTLRLTLAVVLAVLATLLVRAPFLQWLGAYLCFALTRDSAKETVLTCAAVALAVVVAVFVALGLLHAFAAPAWLRLAVLALALFAGFLAARAMPALEDLAHDFSIVVAMVLTLPDVFPYPEEWGAAAFWCIPLALVGAGSAVIATWLVPPRDAFRTLLSALAERLEWLERGAVALAEGRVAEGPTPGLAWPLKELGLARPWELLKPALEQHPELGRVPWEPYGVVAQVDGLAWLGAALGALGGPVTPEERARAAALGRAACATRSALLRGRAPRVASMRGARVAAGGGAAALLLTTAEEELSRLERAFVAGVAAPLPPPPREPLCERGAWSRRAHVRFALKGTVAALLVYGTYTLLGLQELHTALITCLIVARTTGGSILHKVTLRLAGATVGAVLALGATVFLLPHATSLLGFMAILACATAVAAWVAAGSERIAYAGWQLALAVFMMLLDTPGPSTNFSVLGDRLAGILFGNVVMGVVFTSVWPERASEAMWRQLGAAMCALAALLRLPVASAPASFVTRRGAAERRAWSEALDRAVRAMEQAAFEPGAFAGEGLRARAEAASLLRGSLRLFRWLYASSASAAPVGPSSRAGAFAEVVAFHRLAAEALDGLAAELAGEGLPRGNATRRRLDAAMEALAAAGAALPAGAARARLAAESRLVALSARELSSLLAGGRPLPLARAELREARA